MISKRPRCFLDIEISNKNIGRIIVELFMETCPITCENFRLLCSGERGIGKTTKVPLHYKGSLFHRIVKNFVIQGGDFVHGDGRGGESIYGESFKDENFIIPHDEPFILSMANKGKDSNGSQFFITTQAAPHLDGRHTVFGKVISGTEIVTLIENVDTDSNCRPLKDVKIANCGEMVLKVKTKEKKKRRELTESSEDEEKKSRKKRRSHKLKKKHKKDKKEHKGFSDREEDKCLIDPEDIPEVPTNRFLLRNTSPVTQERRNLNYRSRDSYNHRPHRSKSGRKIKGRGFMRYRTPSPTGSKSGSETPPHWKQEQSRLRKMPLPTKEATPEGSGAQEELEEGEDDEMAIQNSLLPSRLGVSKSWKERRMEDSKKPWKGSFFENSRKTWKEDATEDSKKNSSKEKRISSTDRKFLERYSSCDVEETVDSPIRSKVIVKEKDSSDRKFGRDTERKERKELEHGTNFQRHVINEHATNNKVTKTPEKTAEQIAKEKNKFKSLKKNLLKYTNYSDDSDSDDTPEHEAVPDDKSVEKENEAKSNEGNLMNSPTASQKVDEDLKLNKSDSHSPVFNSLGFQVKNEPVSITLDDKLQEPVVKPLVKEQNDYRMEHTIIVENDTILNTASVELNAAVGEKEPKSTSSFTVSPDIESLPFINPVQSVENYDVKSSTNEDTLSVNKLQTEINIKSEFVETEEEHNVTKNKHSDELIKPSTPEGWSPQRKIASPDSKSPQGSSSSSASTKNKRSKSPSDKVASSSRQNRGLGDRRSKSPIHKPRSSSSHRTGRSLASRRTRSRSGRRSTSPQRSRNRRRSPDNRMQRSGSRTRNERGSRFRQYQGMRRYSPPRGGNYYRPYASHRGGIKSAAYRSRSRSRSLSRRRRRQRRSSSSSTSSSGHSSSSDSDARKNKSHKLRKKKRSSSSSSSTGSSESRSDSDSH